jgi:flagellar biosynthesis/type III secretory pathway protein FliH
MITAYEREGIKKGMAKGMEKGMAKGMEKGMAKGVEKGMKKGIEAGLAKGLEQGIEKGKQDLLILLLERKFRKPKVAEKRRIRQITSLDRLDALSLSVLDARSLDELEF